MNVLRKIEDIAEIVSGFAFNEQYQGRADLPIPFIKVSDFAAGINSWLSTSNNTVDAHVLTKMRARTYPQGTIVFPKVGGALLTNKRARLAVAAAMDNNVMGLIPREVDGDYLYYFMCQFDMKTIANSQALPSIRASDVAKIELPVPTLDVQRKVSATLKKQIGAIDLARQAARTQLREISSLAGAIVIDTIRNSPSKPYLLGDVLDEVKQGIGASWADHPVLGATREGLAPAKEQPGKMAPKYKPVTPGTVFYNPMRILIGSIAFVDDDDASGITSPDYVALRGKPGLVDSRWFYYWLRSHLGAQCILSLARGAVRERMLFNRLADGKIDLPSPEAQEKASRALRELKPLQRALKSKLAEIDLLPQKILAQAFEM